MTMPVFKPKVTFKVRWRRKEVNEKLKWATREAMKELLEDCVELAKMTVRVRTGLLQSSIRVAIGSPRWRGDHLHAAWGSFGVWYAIRQELGPAPVFGSRTWAYTPYLRPTADKLYPTLLGRIRSKYRANIRVGFTPTSFGPRL